MALTKPLPLRVEAEKEQLRLKQNEIWGKLRQLNNCLWMEWFEDAKDQVEEIKTQLDEMMEMVESK